MDHEKIVMFFRRVMKDNGIDGEVLCCVVIPDYHELHRHEWKREHLVTRYSMLHVDPPLLKCFCRKEYLIPQQFDIAMNNIDFKIDKDLCEPVKPSNLAFIAFDKISTAREVKRIVT